MSWVLFYVLYEVFLLILIYDFANVTPKRKNLNKVFNTMLSLMYKYLFFNHITFNIL